MNRPGQPQQRPPNITPNPGLSGSFRGPYPPYGMPPRNVNVLQGFVPGLQPSNHRTAAQQSQAQNMVPQPSPGFLQQRTQSSFAFGGPLGQAQGQSQQHQQSTALQQLSSNPQQQSQLQQQQTNGTSSTLPQHLTQNAALPSLAGTAPSVSSASEVGLDPNDFPALGSTPANNNNNPSSSNGNTGNGVTTSYASQAGGVPLGGTAGIASGVVGPGAGGLSGTGGAVGTASQPRDFTPDDFPALGGQSHTNSSHPSQQNQNQENHPPPPGLNGFQHTDHLQHRQNLLGSLGGSGGLQQGTPGMLNLGPAQARNVHPGFQQGQTEAEKQQQRNNYALKLNQATHAAWNSPNVNPGSQSQTGASAFTNATSTTTTAQQNGTHANPSLPQSQPQQTSSQHLTAPPGVPLPANSYAQQQQQQSSHAHAPGAIANTSAANAASAPTSYVSNGLAPGESHNPNPGTLNLAIPPTHGQSHSTTHPQTPAQQILMSAADRWGLLGLLAMIKNAGTDVDQGLSSVGTDLGTMGLDMGYTGNLYSTFITPWADQSAAHTVEPDFNLPGCYNVQPPPPGPNKAAAFSDETLFFMFYSSPRDALQEVAAQELWSRNWRYHKDLRLWITKETGTSPSQKVPGGEQGAYTFWDPENWGKERKNMTVLYADLEEKNAPAFVQGPGLVLAQGQQTQTQAQGTGQQTQQQQTQQQQLQQSQVQQAQRGSFQMGMAGL